MIIITTILKIIFHKYDKSQQTLKFTKQHNKLIVISSNILLPLCFTIQIYYNFTNLNLY